MEDREPAPYARIVAELRERIERGEFGAGDRVPSTREIARLWGVAIATASKVLAELRRAGLVTAVPGVGTVVAGRPAARRRADPPPADPSTPLTPGRIVATAIAVADAEGLDGLSMRRVATDLGAAPMSLYRHVSDRDDLVMRMTDAVMWEEWRPPAEPPPGWRAQLEFAGRTLWAAFRRHPWLAPALSLTRPQPIAGGMAYTEWVLAALDGHGLAAAEALHVHLALFNVVRGTAINLEAEAAAEAASGLGNDEWMATQESALRSIVSSGRYPHFEHVLAGEFDLDMDAVFERSLRYLLDGLAVALATSGRVPRRL